GYSKTETAHFYFIGTNYGSGKQVTHKLQSIINELQLESYISEFPERVSYLATLQIQKKADLLLLPGTTDKNYIASKTATYLMSGNPVLSLYHKHSALAIKLDQQKRIESVFFENIILETE